ncbi:MAG: SH3 domain-containing protein [Anaerolineae bacterium]|nr:SH3 domain-containing protein [Anaerolineae bacterium]
MSPISLVLLILTGVLSLAAILSTLAGLALRSRIASSPYGVGRQEHRRTMQVAFIRALMFGLLALIFFAGYGLSVRAGGRETAEPSIEPPVAETPAAPTPDATATAAALPTATATTLPATPTAPSPAATATPEATATVTITPTPEPSAIVTAPAGIYLRDEPGGSAELELLAEGTVLVLLPGRETVDDLDWQEVRSPSGLEGWVAADFLDYQQ